MRVHPPFLRAQKLPDQLITKHIWDERYEDINAFERYLARNGVVVRKFFLNVSKKEQKKRFLERLEDSKKNWKFSMADVQERGFWKDYQEAYEEMIQHTATKHAPWYVIPADNKWFTRLAVASAIIETLRRSQSRLSRRRQKQEEGIGSCPHVATFAERLAAATVAIRQVSFASHFKIDFDRINQRHQPLEQFLMSGMPSIGDLSVYCTSSQSNFSRRPCYAQS